MKVEILKPSGYCSGVNRALAFLDETIKKYPNKNIYILGDLIHNEDSLKEIEEKGIKIIKSDKYEAIEHLKKEDVVIFTAHGHDEKLDDLCKQKDIIYVDATCPIISKIRAEIIAALKKQKQVVFMGVKGHEETEGILSISKDILFYNIDLPFNYYLITDKAPLIISQSTLNYDDVYQRFLDFKGRVPGAITANEVCPTSRLRQNAIKEVDAQTDLIIIVGSKRSSNSTRLYEIATSLYQNKTVLFVSNVNELKKYDLTPFKKASLISGASTDIKKVNEIANYLSK